MQKKFVLSFCFLLVILLVVGFGCTNLPTGRIGYQYQGANYQSAAESITQAKPRLSVSLQDVNLNLNGQNRGLTVLRLDGNNGKRIILNINGLNIINQYIYFVVKNTTVNGFSYVGNIIYENGTNLANYSVGEMFLHLDNGTNSYYYKNEYNTRKMQEIEIENNDYIFQSSIPLFSIFYNTTSQLLAKPELVEVVIDGVTEHKIGYTSYSGDIKIVDGYKESSWQGGTWIISFYNANLGNIVGQIGKPAKDNLRSLYYRYYQSSIGPLIDGEAPDYKPAVSLGFKSPAGTVITKVNKNVIRLEEDPGQIVDFGFTCYDNDPTNDIFVRGSILKMRNSDNSEFVPYDSFYRDSGCYGGNMIFDETGVNVGQNFVRTINKAYVEQVSCDSNNLPKHDGRFDCPSIDCSNDRNVCASPTTFTCSDSDGGGSESKKNVPGIVTLVSSSTGHNWTFVDRCLSPSLAAIFGNTENGGVMIGEFYCASTSSSTPQVKKKKFSCTPQTCIYPISNSPSYCGELND